MPFLPLHPPGEILAGKSGAFLCTQWRGSEHVRRIVTHLSGEEHAMNSSILNIILVIICVLWYQVRGFSEAILTRCFLYYLEMPVNHLCLAVSPRPWLKYLQAFILLSSLWSGERGMEPHLCHAAMRRRGAGGSLQGGALAGWLCVVCDQRRGLWSCNLGSRPLWPEQRLSIHSHGVVAPVPGGHILGDRVGSCHQCLRALA